MAAKPGRINQEKLTGDMYALYILLRSRGAFDEERHEDGGEVSIPIDELAVALNTDAASVIKWADGLSCCGAEDYLRVPIYTDTEQGAIVSFGSYNVLERSLRLSPVECHAILRALDKAGIPEDDKLRIELTRNAGSKGFEPDNISATTESVRFKLELLMDAIDSHLAVRFLYRSRDDEEARSRSVQPARLYCDNGAWYLAAFVSSLDQWRTYRVDKINAPELTDERFDLKDSLPDSFRYELLGNAPRATIRVSSQAYFERGAWIGIHKEREEEDGFYASVPYKNIAWLADMVIAGGGDIVLVEDEAMKGVVENRCAQKEEQLDKALAAAKKLTDPELAPSPVPNLQDRRYEYCRTEELLEMFSHSAS